MEVAGSMRPEKIPCANIRPDLSGDRNPPRELDTLVDSIRLHGVLHPVLLRATVDGYLIVHGERRWRAAQIAGLETIPALIIDDFSRHESASALWGASLLGSLQPE